MSKVRAVTLPILVVASVAHGSNPAYAEACRLSEGYCVPVLGCIEETSEYFEGRTYGKTAGTFAVDASDGATCFGDWRRAAMGMGLGDFACDDERTGSVVFYYLDKDTGTALGRGTTNNNKTVRFWAGHNLPQFFGRNDVAAEVMTCGDAEVALTS